uniref:Uncharacterized protein n=1 Tax=Rhizophora mucronata TaxID=61149 RepID=A0A2P2NFU5_RHIMU
MTQALTKQTCSLPHRSEMDKLFSTNLGHYSPKKGLDHHSPKKIRTLFIT